MLLENNGIIEENGKTYNLRNNEQLLAYINREIETKEKYYDGDIDQIPYNRRQIKYLFGQMIEFKYEQKMKPEYEKNFANDMFKTTALNERKVE